MYLSFEEYQNMGGTLDNATFSNLEFIMSSKIDWYTFNRLKKESVISDTVKKLMYRLIQLEYTREQAMSLGQDPSGNNVNVSGAISSQSNDGYSTNYNVVSASESLKVTDSEMQNIISMALQGEVNSLGHKLLYRGIYEDE